MQVDRVCNVEKSETFYRQKKIVAAFQTSKKSVLIFQNLR